MAATRVFAVRTDFGGDTFRTLVVPDEDARLRMLSLFPWDGTSLADGWVPQLVAFHEKAGVIPDVLHLWHPNVPVLSRKAREVLGNAPYQCGELLPVEVDAQTMWIWHITQRASCLDSERSDVPVHGPMALFFVSERLPSGPSFLVAYPRMRGRLFLVERADERVSLRSLFEDGELTGLSFVEVWSSPNGPVPYDPMRS